MEQEKGLMKVQMTTPMIQTAFETLDGMKKLAQEFLDSQIIPVHFYEKGPDNKPDFSKGQVSKVVAVWIKGDQLGLHPMTSLQEIVPVNGLLSIKGDGAKALILRSGKIEPGSWKEQSKGSIPDGDYEVTITATRADTKETLSRSFSVALAKRAGLWIDQSMLQKQDGWKWKHSPWYKYPDRMIKYRALGFLARDLFPDVMNGTYTMEEAQDFPQDQSIVVDAGDAQVIIQDKDFNEQRSKQLTSKVAEKIDKANHKSEGPMRIDYDAEKKIREYPLTTVEATKKPTEEKDPNASFREAAAKHFEKEEQAKPAGHRGVCEVMLNGSPDHIVVYSEDELKEMALEDLHGLIDKDDLMKKARDIDPQKNTNKKLRTIILSKYAGETVYLIEKFDREDPEAEKQIAEDLPDSNEDIQPNEDFDKETEPEPEDNKYGIEVPETVEGKRTFDQVKTLFEDMSNMAGVDNNTFEQLINTKFPEYQTYRTKEDFCYKATKAEINALLNSV